MSNATDLKSLAEEMAAAYTQRKQDIGRIRKDTASLLSDAAKQDKARAAENAKFIAEAAQQDKARAKDNEALKAEAKDLVAEAAARDVERAGENVALMADFAKQDKARAGENDALIAETKALVAETAKQNKALKAETDNVVAGFHAEQAETAAAWQGLVAKMRGVRGGKVAAAPRKAKRAKPRKPAVAERLVEHIEEALSPAALKRKVLSEIRKNNEEGAKLATVAEELGLESWRDVLPAARELVAEGKVQKEGSLYFA